MLALGAFAQVVEDRIQQGHSFWTPFKTHARLRHQIVHKRKAVTEADAQASLRAASDLVAHVEFVIGSASA